ncbi:MAG: hypothetical protein Q7T55_16150, partial [Solirubrobacteraceae bacterium]|nr:hypothetical protein [Solirubrobacteraceae bacterium]
YNSPACVYSMPCRPAHHPEVGFLPKVGRHADDVLYKDSRDIVPMHEDMIAYRHRLVDGVRLTRLERMNR